MVSASGATITAAKGWRPIASARRATSSARRSALMACTGVMPIEPFGKHRGTGFAGPLVLPPARGSAKRHEVREYWGRASCLGAAVGPAGRVLFDHAEELVHQHRH